MQPLLVPTEDWKNIPERSLRKFRAMIDKSAGGDACWPWIGKTRVAGYGVWQRRPRKGAGVVSYRAHRLALFLETGILGEVALHMCDNKLCCNPRHLKWGTQIENRSDCVAKGRHARGGSHGMAKHMSDQVVRDIRKSCADGATRSGLAKKYGVSQSAIGRIASGRAWRHVP
jgi:hypothetical protein